MKINSIPLAVFLNFIAIALAAPMTTTSQETNNAADHTSNSLEGRDFFGGLAVPVVALVSDTLGGTNGGTPGSTSAPATVDSGTLNGMDPAGYDYSGLSLAGGLPY